MKLVSIFLSFVIFAAVLPSVAMAEDALEQKGDFASAAITDNELDTYRGGSSESLLTNNMSAVFQNNNCNDCTSGANGISNSFNNINGMTNVILNSGNNVIIQSSFQVNVNFGQ